MIYLTDARESVTILNPAKFPPLNYETYSSQKTQIGSLEKKLKNEDEKYKALQNTNTQLVSKKEKLTTSNTQLEITKEKLTTSNTQLESTKEKLTDSNMKLTKTNTQLEKTVKE